MSLLTTYSLIPSPLEVYWERNLIVSIYTIDGTYSVPSLCYINYILYEHWGFHSQLLKCGMGMGLTHR